MSAATAKVEDVLITSREDIHLASHSMKAMAHPLRLKILCILGGNTGVSVETSSNRSEPRKAISAASFILATRAYWRRAGRE
jgi:hypothetical protein